LTILGIAVAVLAVYTLVFSGRREGPTILAATQAARAAARQAEPAATPAPAVPDSATASPGPGLTLLTPEPQVWGSDPFVRDVLLVNELANFKLKAVTIGGDRASALINDQILEEGDVISGKRVAAIAGDRVTLEQGGRTFVLMLGE
jgi:hypothetical protein